MSYAEHLCRLQTHLLLTRILQVVCRKNEQRSQKSSGLARNSQPSDQNTSTHKQGKCIISLPKWVSMMMDWTSQILWGTAFWGALGQGPELVRKWTLKARHCSNLKGTAHPKMKMIVSSPTDYLYSVKHNTFCKMQLRSSFKRMQKHCKSVIKVVYITIFKSLLMAYKPNFMLWQMKWQILIQFSSLNVVI